MFTWVCPRCGRENSPSYTECPDCAVRDREEAAQQPVPAPVAGQPVHALDMTRTWEQVLPTNPTPPPQPLSQATQPQYAPQQPQYAQPPQYSPQPQPPQYAPQQPQYAPPTPQYQAPQYHAPQHYPPQQLPSVSPYQAPSQLEAPPRQQPPPTVQHSSPPLSQTRQLPPLKPVQAPARPSGLAALPVWLLMILFTAGFLAVGAGIYYGYRAYNSGPAGFTGGNPPATTSKAKPSNPLQKYIEVVGVRLTNDAKKKPIAKYLVVNHSDGVIADLSGTVTLWASTSRSEEDSVGSFLFHIDTLKPNESRDVTSPLKTKLKMYELPDWQNLTAEVQITSPQQ